MGFVVVDEYLLGVGLLDFGPPVCELVGGCGVEDYEGVVVVDGGLVEGGDSPGFHDFLGKSAGSSREVDFGVGGGVDGLDEFLDSVGGAYCVGVCVVVAEEQYSAG